MRPDPLIQSGTIPALHKIPAPHNQELNKKTPHAFNGAPLSPEPTGTLFLLD